MGSKARLKNIAKDIVTHFEQRQIAIDGKGMIVAMSRRIAAALYREIVALRPEWHSSDLKQALAFYPDSGGKGDPAVAQEQAVALINRINRGVR